ncbi:unnamed protein product [Rotaria sp. Silwood1]|nr:unnamed protein product [Rotaria sp. Silwood1]
MKQFILSICLLLAISYPTIARDPSQTMLMNYLARVSDKRALLSNETFYRTMFQSFRNDHPRQYQAPDNETTHYQIFQNRLKEAVESNIESNLTFTVGLNKFSDWKPKDLQILRGNRPPASAVRTNYGMVAFSRTPRGRASKKYNNQTPVIPPATFDYTTEVSKLNTSVSIIRPVRDQGYCGSCYAFAIITLFEAQYAFHFGQAVNMSDQQIVDCSTGDYGCVGGYFDTSFAYVQSYAWYLNSATDYPYKAVASTCSAKKTGGWSVDTSVYRHLTPGNASAMQEALLAFGPLWVSLYVGSDCSGTPKSKCPVDSNAASRIMHAFQSYTGGIFKIDGCVTSADNNNHAMVIVGYGHDPNLGLDYWKLRNSWSSGWGEDGYVRIQRGVNMCNVESDAFFIAKPAS